MLDGTAVGEYQLEPKDSGGAQWNMICGFWVGPITSGSHTVTMTYNRSGGGGTVSVRKARIDMWRIL